MITVCHVHVGNCLEALHYLLSKVIVNDIFLPCVSQFD